MEHSAKNLDIVTYRMVLGIWLGLHIAQHKKFGYDDTQHSMQNLVIDAHSMALDIWL